MESCWPSLRWRNRCSEQMRKWTHIYQGKWHGAGYWLSSWSCAICRDDSGCAKSKTMEREQTEECQLTQDQDWAGLLRVRALVGESESWDLYPVSTRIKEVMIWLSTLLCERVLANLSPMIRWICIFQGNYCWKVLVLILLKRSTNLTTGHSVVPSLVWLGCICWKDLLYKRIFLMVPEVLSLWYILWAKHFCL